MIFVFSLIFFLISLDIFFKILIMILDESTRSLKKSNKASFFITMKRRKWDQDILSIIEPILAASGFRPVQLDLKFGKGLLRITLVIHSPKGVSLEDCVQLHKTLLPRLELEKSDCDVYLDIFSPGVGRNLKSVEEFHVFEKEAVKILCYEQHEWLEGFIEVAEEEELLLKVKQTEGSEEKVLKIRYNEIQKAKLV